MTGILIKWANLGAEKDVHRGKMWRHKENLIYRPRTRGPPGGPLGKTPPSMPRVQTRPLVGELRSHVPRPKKVSKEHLLGVRYWTDSPDKLQEELALLTHSLIFDFQPPGLWEYILLFKPPSLWFSVIADSGN